jgi:hypothetical protein
MFKAPKYFEPKPLRAEPKMMRGVFHYYKRVSPRTELARTRYGHNPLWLLRYLAFR